MEDLRGKLFDRITEVQGKISQLGLAKEFDTTEWQAREAMRAYKTRPLGPTVGYFDLETTHLIADLGTCLMGSILTYPTMEMTTFSIADYDLEKDEYGDTCWDDDRQLVTDIRDHLMRHHILVGWHSKGFDVPFLNTRLIDAGQAKLPTHLHLDPMYCFRGWHGLKPRSSKLAIVAEFFGLEERKQQVDVKVWKKASIGNRRALGELVERCESDVRILAEITQRAFDAGLVKNIQRYA